MGTMSAHRHHEYSEDATPRPTALDRLKTWWPFIILGLAGSVASIYAVREDIGSAWHRAYPSAQLWGAGLAILVLTLITIRLVPQARRVRDLESEIRLLRSAVADSHTTPFAADVALYNEFVKLFPSDSAAMWLAREHIFNAGFDSDEIDDFREFITRWNAEDRRFRDGSVESARQGFADAVSAFLRHLDACTTLSADGRRVIYVAQPDPDAFPSPLMGPAARKAEQLGRDVWKERETLVRIARERLGL